MKLVQPLFISTLLTVFVCKLQAQNNTSAYSVVGLGDIEKSSFDRTSGMGHAGLALSSDRFLYQANPASYSSLTDYFFHFEASARYKYVGYTGQPVTGGNSSSDLQFKKLAAAIKIKPRWAISVGLLPYSTANFSFYAQKSIQGSTSTATSYYQGTGSTNQFYLANSYKFSKNFSLGLQMSYLFGQVAQTENIGTNVTDSVLTTTRNMYVSNLLFKAGFQYKTKVGKNWSIGAGGTFSPKTKLRATTSVVATYGNNTYINNPDYSSGYYYLPTTYGGGISATYKEKMTFAVDYVAQNWADLNYGGVSYKLVNSNRISAGVEIAKKLIFTDNTTGKIYKYDKYFYQAGFFYANSYTQFSGQQIADYGGTIGMGINGNRLGLMGALEVGQRGTTGYGLVKEDYVQFTLTFSYRDSWYRSRKKFY